MENKKENILKEMKKSSKRYEEEHKRALEKIKNDKEIFTYVMGIGLAICFFILVTLMGSFAMIFVNKMETRIEIGIVGIIVSAIFMIVYGVNLRKLMK